MTLLEGAILFLAVIFILAHEFFIDDVVDERLDLIFCNALKVIVLFNFFEANWGRWVAWRGLSM